jgi:hypothetical protein
VVGRKSDLEAEGMNAGLYRKYGLSIPHDVSDYQAVERAHDLVCDYLERHPEVFTPEEKRRLAYGLDVPVQYFRILDLAEDEIGRPQ